MCGRCFAYAAGALHVQAKPVDDIGGNGQKSLGHLLFDLDGTLTDPREGILNCFRYAIGSLGFPVPPDDQLERWIGPPLVVTLAEFFGKDRPDLAARAVELYRERFRASGMFENRVYTGIPEALSTLAQSGWTLWLATSKAVVFAREILQHFELSRYFAGIHGAELSGERADKGELIAHILESENIAASDAIMIGDRCHDIRGAKCNGLRSMGVLWGYGSHDELAEAGADSLHANLGSLVAQLKSLHGYSPNRPSL